MHLPRCFWQRQGMRHAYWALVESYRTARGRRQSVVRQIGEMDANGRVGVRSRAEGKHQCELLDGPGPEWVEVDVKRASVERKCGFGGPWLGLELCRSLGLPEFLDAAIATGREDIPWPMMSLVLVLGRLCDPSSEPHLAEHSFASGAPGELLGIPAEKVNDDRLYRLEARLCPRPDGLRCSFFAAARSEARRNTRCLSGSRTRLRRGWTRSQRRAGSESRGRARWSGAWGGYWEPIRGRRGCLRCVRCRRPMALWSSPGSGARLGASGRTTAKAVICCAAMSPIGLRKSCGAPVSSNWPRPRRHSGFTSRIGPYGIRSANGWRRTFWRAFSDRCRGRPWGGSAGRPASAMSREWYSRRSARLLWSMSCSPPATECPSGNDASPSPTTMRRFCCYASDCSCFLRSEKSICSEDFYP